MLKESDIIKCFITQNDCYKKYQKMTPKGIVVHDTAAGNVWLNRYTQPSSDDPNRAELLKLIGQNKYNNHWNKSGVSKAVNAFIGQRADGELAVCQTLPWDCAPWGCGSGTKGSYNNTHIQFEIQDDNYNAGKGTKEYFEKAMNKAIELCAYLANKYNIPISEIVNHSEANKLGYASNHSDTVPWMTKYGWTMDIFRQKVKEKIDEVKEAENQPDSEPEKEKKVYIVHAGGFGKKEEALEAVEKVKGIYSSAYVSQINGVFYARCETNANRDYALRNAEKLEDLVENPGIFVK